MSVSHNSLLRVLNVLSDLCFFFPSYFPSAVAQFLMSVSGTHFHYGSKEGAERFSECSEREKKTAHNSTQFDAAVMAHRNEELLLL